MAIATKANPTESQIYAGLNARFEKRIKQLRKLGFKYETVEVAPRCTIAVFVRSRFGKTVAIQSATVMHASKQHFISVLAQNKF